MINTPATCGFAVRHATDCTMGPVVQSIVSLMSSLVVNIFTVLVSTISNSQVFLLTFSKNILWVYTIFNDLSFNDTLTNNIVNFDQMGLDSTCFYKFLVSTELFKRRNGIMQQDLSPERIAHLKLHILLLENFKSVTLILTWPACVCVCVWGGVGGGGGGGVRILHCAKVSSNQRWIKSVTRLGNNKVLKT